MPSWFLYAALSAIFAALTATFIKLGTQSIDSDVATFYRTILIVFVTLAVVLIKQKRLTFGAASGKEILFLSLSAVATGLSWLAYFRAMKEGPISKVQLIDKSSVILVVLIGLLFFQEHLSIKGGIGAALVVGGLYLLYLG
jgi:bacterial/archaeal transporter family protein